MRNTSSHEQFTAARIRIHESSNGAAMRIGFNSIAERYFSMNGIRKLLETSMDSEVSASVISNPNEAPYVGYALELAKPLSAEQLTQLGGLLVSGALLSERPSIEPDGIGVYDNRGRNMPDNPVDRGEVIAQQLPNDIPNWPKVRHLAAA